MHRRLLCLDLDGTLLRPDGSIAPNDRIALERADREGVLITIATGRMMSGALPIARALGITIPIICADGGMIACATSGTALEVQAIAQATARACLYTVAAHGLWPLVVLPGTIHGHEACRAHAPHLDSWTPIMEFYDQLDTIAPLEDVMLVLALGTQDAADAARDTLTCEHGHIVEATSFAFGAELFAVRAQPRGCAKGTALARLAADLGIAREHVAAVGDWMNDISMLAWAGRSFAMGHAPAIVRAAATDTLDSTAGGGVAEAVERWLGPGQ